MINEVPRIKGKHREVRQLLAEQSRQLLKLYRDGTAVPAASCLLTKALAQPWLNNEDAVRCFLP